MSEQPNRRARDQADGYRLAEDAPTDVEDRTAAQQELLHAQKMASIGRLAGGIAHDVNSMLSAIRGFAELLHEDLERQPLPPTDELRHSVDAIRSAADRAAALTAQLLALSRGQVRAPVPLNLAIAVRNMEPMLRSLMGEQTQLVIRPDPSTGSVRADPGQVDQVLINLIMNARDAMPDGGTARLETSNVDVDGSQDRDPQQLALPPGRYVILAVSDTGRSRTARRGTRSSSRFSATLSRGAAQTRGWPPYTASFGRAKATSGCIRRPGRARRSASSSRVSN